MPNHRRQLFLPSLTALAVAAVCLTALTVATAFCLAVVPASAAASPAPEWPAAGGDGAPDSGGDDLPASTVPFETLPSEDIVPGQPWVPGQLLVQYADGEAPQAIEVPPGADLEALASRVERSPAIVSATPNYIASASGWLPNDPGVNPARTGRAGDWQLRQWNFLPCHSLCYPGTVSTGPQSLGGMNVIRAWQNLRRAGRPGAQGVRIAVLDTGVAYRNLGRMYRRDPELSPKTFVRGYDFVEDDRIPLDLNGHGTHVASTIAQATNNRRGLTGIAFGARVMPVRVLDSNGFGTTLDIIRGLRWAARNDAKVINMSLNFSCGESIPALGDALQYARSRGAVVVASAGNSGAQTCPSLPATHPTVISVGGTTESGCVATYSFESEQIDLAAPGGGSSRSGCPFSSAERSIFQVGMIARDPRWFGIEPSWTGTSMAAAHVSAAAAAVLASKVLPRGKRGAGEVLRRLESTARLPAYAQGNAASGFGAGIVDLGRATNPNAASA
jgi:serine protease